MERKQPIAEIDFPNGDGITISLEQLDKRKAMQYEIEFNDSNQKNPNKKRLDRLLKPIKRIYVRLVRNWLTYKTTKNA